ncbi:DUF6069 family protein [Micromonospora sp. WMMD812]|uniref:DUF6069 family protein n=1 Tax=Micromonospora sp. WMMD812 TaxID=3015152 RepID=UPI00248B7DAA|nr:DUF6069 family protein [Micromonospora sp. WMMD812]WBB68381.1 DUF6069 family protein [Micromonospora sp. WMMD812]
MTNDMQRTDTINTTARRTGRATTVAAGAAGVLLLWVVNDPWAGIDLAVRQGDATRHIGPVAVVMTALIAGLAAWGLLALLERTVRRPARTFRIIALIVLVLSLAGPLGSGVGTSSRLVLLGMHLTVGAALIIGLPGRRTCR